jgi:hypothetical protein
MRAGPRFVRMIALAALTFAAQGLVFADGPMRAQYKNEGGDGKCTFEVEVDITAQVEIRGDQGYVRTLAGSPANWRRLVCNQPLPRNPVNFRFKGIDGRGRQTLIRDPNSNNGVAVIQLDDPKGGREGYTGDILWKRVPGNGAYPGSDQPWDNGWGGPGNGGNRPFPGNGFPPPRPGGGWGNSNQFSGNGRGGFDRNGGPRLNLSSVDVRVDQSRGIVTAVFDTNAGRNSLSFQGRIASLNNSNLEANIVSATNGSGSGQARGRMSIQMGRNRRLASIQMNGDINGGSFRLNWNARF